jgi:hypothetical protein
MSIESDLRALFKDIDEVSELKGTARRAYNKKHGWFPPSLPAGKGRQIFLSSVGFAAVRRVCSTMRANDRHLAAAYSHDEMIALLRSTIGRLLMANAGPEEHSFETPADALAFKTKLTASIRADASSLRPSETHAFGVWTFSGQAGVAPISMGPVWLGPREIWLKEVRIGSALNKTAKERISRGWQGKTLRKRKSRSFLDEQDVLAAIGDCPWICTVHLGGHANERSRQKAILAARIALATVALCWQRPSDAAASMGLLIDGPGYRHASFAYTEKGPVGVWRQRQLRMGAVIFPEDARTFAEDYQDRFAVVGDALRSFLAVQPEGSMAEPGARLCRALTWFWEACNAPLDFMAITKFATSMDVLCDGQDDYALCQLLKKCGDFSPDETLLKDGTSVKGLVTEVYTAGRSKFLHGARPSLVEDLAVPRTRAELLASLTLKSYISWIGRGADCTDMSTNHAA